MSTVPARRDLFVSAARAVAEQPALIDRLLAEHPAVRGWCPGCTIPGGVLRVMSPCSIHQLAALANRFAAR